MGRSKESLKRKRSSRSSDSGYYSKRRNTNANCIVNLPPTNILSQSATSQISAQSICDVITYPHIRYYSWIAYFNSHEYNEESLTVKKIDALIEHFESRELFIDLANRVDLDVSACFNDSDLLEKWPNIEQDFNVTPHYTLNCINVALFEVMMHRATAETSRSAIKLYRILQLNKINIINYESLINPMPCVKLSSYGKLISIGCTVIGIGSPKFGIASVAFTCKCNRQIIVKQYAETQCVSPPTKCNVCGNGKFKRLLDSPYQINRIRQTLIVKDNRPVSDRTLEEDAISPNVIDVNLADSLLDKFVPGDNIHVVGIPRITLGEIKSSTAGSCPLYLEAISVFRNDELPSIHINEEVIERIKSERDVLSLLVHSLCPTVQGHEMIKAALILGLVGGNFARNEPKSRDNVHTLIIGNLGLGKSELLRACKQASAQGVYIRADSNTTLEPTMTNVRKTGNAEDSRLEIGEFASADRSICCIDQLDKSLARQHRAISNFMEQQTVGTVNSELKFRVAARASVFGIINPIRKSYDPSKTVAENVNANPNLLSKFDMVFLMRDNPSKYSDRLMCDRVFDAYTKRFCPLSNFSSQSLPLGHKNEQSVLSICDNTDRNLREKLVNGVISDLLPQKLLRMYLNYARTKVQPEISTYSKTVIVFFCLRRYQQDREHTKLERLFRTLVVLIQARARVDLRDVTTQQDALDVIEILEHAAAVHTKDRTLMPARESSSKLTGNKMKQFLDDLRNEAVSFNKITFTTEELRNIAGKENITQNSLSTLLARLNEQGYLLKVSSNSYKVVLD